MYYIVYGLLYSLSLLPMRVLYIFSGSLYLLLYHIAGYRRKVVMHNLAIAFPGKTEKERTDIAKKFYRNFADNFIETLKLMSASKSFITKHFIVDNPELTERFQQEGRKCQLFTGHIFNWEMACVGLPLYTAYPFLVVYMPVDNKMFDRIFKKMRSRTNSILLPATELNKAILPYRKVQYSLSLVADQAPGNFRKAYWLNFFGQPTPFMQGPERGARIADIPAVFVHFYKTGRGHYRVRFKLLSDNPAKLPVGELTRRFVYLLEEGIMEEPSMWLWTHRRWKHEWKEEYGNLWIGEDDPRKGFTAYPS